VTLLLKVNDRESAEIGLPARIFSRDTAPEYNFVVSCLLDRVLPAKIDVFDTATQPHSRNVFASL
jgi:hypothetical protein